MSTACGSWNSRRYPTRDWCRTPSPPRSASARNAGDRLPIRVDYLKEQSLLLMLDNCGHLITACAQLADRVLRSAPNVRVLATSREPLAITGETVVRVPSLGVPDPERPPDVQNLSGHEAVELFVDRARSVKSTFAITPATAAPLARLCARLEGIPLAIELAVSRVKVLSIEQIAERLDDRLNSNTSGRLWHSGNNMSAPRACGEPPRL